MPEILEKPKQKHLFHSIPKEMQNFQQWVLWKREPKRNNEYTKIPYQLNGYKASSTNPQTWTSFENVCRAYSSGKWDGIGFVFSTHDPFVGIDLDGCISPGSIKDDKKPIVDSLASYTEKSQSGLGLHVIVKGGDIGKGFNNQDKGVEMYSKGRFFAMTGDVLSDDLITIEDRNGQVLYLDEMYRPNEKQNEETGSISDQTETLTDDQILMKARNDKSRDKFICLFDNGDISGYPSESEADQALANKLWWYSQNIDQTERLMRESALYREKWDKHPDYLKERTIYNAARTVKGGYRQGEDFQLYVKESDEKETKFILNEDGSIKKILHNLKVMLLKNDSLNGLGFNEFTEEVTVNGVPITDYDISEIRLWVDSKFYTTFKKDDIIDVLESLAKQSNSYHPIKQMIESKKWDGTPRAETVFIDYLGAEDDSYIRSVSKKWLAGSVARIYEPGMKMDIVPVLQGGQGLGKSTMASKLGGQYFVDSLMSLGNTKDDYQMLIDSWIIELSELSSIGVTQIEKVKGFISAQSDKLRMPYGKVTQNYKRTCTFIGTTNTSQFLNDLTGNRRFFPIPIKNKAKKDVFSLDDETIQQIWAEAYEIYRNGEKLFLDDQWNQDLAEVYREQATEENLLFSDIDDYLNMPVRDDWNTKTPYQKQIRFEEFKADGVKSNYGNNHFITKTTAKEIAYMLGLESTNRTSNAQIKKISMYMENKDDWKKKPIKINGRTERGFARVQKM